MVLVFVYKLFLPNNVYYFQPSVHLREKATDLCVSMTNIYKNVMERGRLLNSCGFHK